MKHLAFRAALLSAAASLALAGALTAAQAAAPVCTIKTAAADLGPTGIIGQGPNGAKAASVNDVQLTDEEVAKAKAGHFKVGLVMHTMNLDWSQLQIQGIKDTLGKYGVEVIGVTAADYKADKQMADIENTVQRKPDGIISIPVDGTATAPAYKKAAEAGVKLVFMDNVPAGLTYPKDFASMVSADSQGNGWIAAKVLSECIPKGGTVGIVNFGIDFFVTNERTKGVKDWLAKNRPDIKVKQADFTDPSKVTQIAGDFLTANPDVQGLFAVWDAPAMDALSAMRAQGITIPVTTIDLSLESAIGIAKGGPLVGTGSQRPYDQGVAEALAMVKALVGGQPPAWIGVQSLPVIQANLMEGYKTVFHKDAPAELTKVCKAAEPNCR